MTTQTIPGPNPLFGWRSNLVRFFVDPILFMSNLKARYGSVVTFAQGGNPALAFSHPQTKFSYFLFGSKYNQQLLSDSEMFHSGPVMGPLYPHGEVGPRKAVLQRLGSGLFAVNGEEHRQQRALVMPAFHKKQIMSYHQDMVTLAQAMLDSWQEGQTVNVAQEMMQLTLNVAGKCLFGLDFTQNGHSLGRLMQNWLRTLVRPALLLAPVDFPGLPYHYFLDLSVELDQAIRDLLAQKRANGLDGQDALSMLLQTRDEAGVSLSEEEIIGHVNILVLAGHETSSQALTWTLFLLSQHPAVLADLVDELQQNVPAGAPTLDQLTKLPLLDRVVKESMRLLPPVPMSARLASEPVEVDGYLVPQWSELVFSHYHTHHDPELYAEPERFRPERWQTIQPTAYEYMPFSAGKRMCIGAPFALMEIKIVLALLLQRYRLEMPPNSKIDYLVTATIAPKQGLKMIIRPQDRQFQQSQQPVTGTIRQLVELPA